MGKRRLERVEAGQQAMPASGRVRLTHNGDADSLPVAALKRCRRIERIGCEILWSLEGCPDGLNSLIIRNGDSLKSLESISACKELQTLEMICSQEISNLSALSSCTRLKKLIIKFSKITYLTPLSSLTLLDEVDLSFRSIEGPSTCLPPLSHCKKLDIRVNDGIEDLSPLCQCPDLEELCITSLVLIKDSKNFDKVQLREMHMRPDLDLNWR
jgi:hypothetical protein